MKQTDAVTAIYQRWMSEWPTLSGGVPYVFDNDVADESSTYARVSIIDLGSEQQTYGNPGYRRFTRSGIITVRLKGPANQGRKLLDQLADYVRDVFETRRLAASGTEEGLVTFSTSSESQPTDGRFWILLVSTPFEYYELR